MSSFFGRLKGTTSPLGATAGSTPTKKDPNAPLPTPLEKLLLDAGPIRTDGSDKFFGFENFGSTCYCNSIIQCLYYSAPFREQVINFPTRSPYEFLKRKSAAISSNEDTHGLSPVKTKTIFSTPQVSSSPRTKQVPTPSGNQQAQKQEENKDSPEFKKKVALATGPVLTMNYENSTAYGMTESLFASLKDIFEAVIAHESRIGVVSPYKLLEILRRENEMFRTPMHQDAHEFLNLLLNQVVENVEQYSKTLEAKKDTKGEETELTRTMTSLRAPATKGLLPSSRWVHELFEGTLTSETRCLTCENISQRDEAFLDLSVDLEQHSSVTACLRRFSEEEMLCERNKFHCDKCGGLQEAEKRMKIKRLPRILALHLKRFKYTEDMQRLQKLFHRVVYPFYLRLFNTTDDAEDPDRLYELYAVVVHIGGGPYHGHYVSIIKTQDRGWLLFDDEMVEPVDKRFVLKFFGEGVNEQGIPINLACAYVLFYQETTLEAMQNDLESEGTPAAPESQPSAHTKTNGANGVLNGVHAHPATTPLAEEVEQFANLDHAATITVAALAGSPAAPFQNPLEATQTSPSIPFLRRKKSNALGKKEQERLEKEEKERRKAAEKEVERQAKQIQKEQKAAQKEALKKQEEEAAARYKAAGKPNSNASSRAGDDESYSSNGNQQPRGLGIDDDQQHFQQAPTSHPRENGVAATGAAAKDSGSMLHRFKTTTSMSLRQKPKFWGKDKDKDKEKKPKNSGDHSDLSHEAFAHQTQSSLTLTPSETGESSTATATSGSPHQMDSPEFAGMLKPGPVSNDKAIEIPEEKPERKSKEKSRFGLGRKKSVNLLGKSV